MLPMVPNNRDNMIAWLAARCDGPNYGKVIEFAFSKEKLIYGPAQIEARIDQDLLTRDAGLFGGADALLVHLGHNLAGAPHLTQLAHEFVGHHDG